MRILAFILSLLIFVPVQAEPTRTYTGNKANTNLPGETEKPDIASIKFSPDGTKVLFLRLIVFDLTIDSVKYFTIPIGGISDLIYS